MDIGLDRLPTCEALVRELKGSRVGLLAHPASVDRELRHISDVLLALGVKPKIIFGPEHGYGGEAQDMIGVPSARDARLGAPIVSLYGDTFEDLSPRDEHLSEIDVLLIDLADVGARYYTFIWSALLAVRAASKHGVRSIILDRPNPISGDLASVEGRAPSAGFFSFVGLESIPVRHAMTLAEVVALFAHRDGLTLGRDEALAVVDLVGWDRQAYADAWDRPFVMTSPNMPSLDTAIVYPGGCLLEGTNLSDGRGTTRPFELTGAPFVDGRRLSEALASLPLRGFYARPITFQPTFHKHAGKICGGVQLHVTDRKTFRPYATYLALIALARQQDPEQFRFRTEKYEYVDHLPAYDILTGSSVARERSEAGDDPAAWLAEIADPSSGFAEDVELAGRLVESARRS